MSAVRKPAQRLARPAARYWKGKAPKGVAEADSDSDDAEEPEVEQEGDVLIGGDQDIVEQVQDEDLPIGHNAIRPPTKAMNFALKDMDISRETQVQREAAKRLEESEEDDEDEDKDEHAKADLGESSEEEESSEEDEPQKPQYRPVFVPKRSRVTIAEKEALADDSEEAIKKREDEAEERRKQSHDLVAESIRRELAEKEKEEEIPDVDDTDGIDPEAEFEAWRLRELARIKKEKEDEVRREIEREEVERRRALPEAQRMKEDLEHAAKLRDEKPKGQQKFLQKYWHKGAFHQDAEVLTRHDFTESTESTVDVSMLPKVMQVKNFGKRSRTKYTHLLDQDTTVSSGGFGGTAPVKSGGMAMDGGGCFLCGGPHMKKDCPQNTGPLTARGGAGSGANNTTPGSSKQWGGPPRDTDRSWRDGGRNGPSQDWRDDRDRDYKGSDYRDGRDDDQRGSGRRRFRSPDRRYGHDTYSSRRQRSRSRSNSPSRFDEDDDHHDKRRRVNS